MADHEWQFREFPAPDGQEAAVTFLNEPDRQGPGEASVTPRGNGTAGLLFLEPGSLGTSAGISMGPPMGAALTPACAASSTTPPGRQDRRRWRTHPTQHPARTRARAMKIAVSYPWKAQ